MRVFVCIAFTCTMALPLRAQSQSRAEAVREAVELLSSSTAVPMLARDVGDKLNMYAFGHAQRVLKTDALTDTQKDAIILRVNAFMRARFRERDLFKALMSTKLSELTDEELRELVAFMRKPAGQRVASHFLGLAGDLADNAASVLRGQLADVAREAVHGEASDDWSHQNTDRDLYPITSAIEEYRTNRGRYPAAAGTSELLVQLGVTGRLFRETDGWGRPLRYVVSADGQHYNLVSGGSDGKVEPASLQFRAAHASGDDLVVVDSRRVEKAPAEPEVSDRAVRVGGDVKAPTVITRVEPEYTEEAKASRIQGIVFADVIIETDGSVSDVTILKGLPAGLDAKAAEALRQWIFKPATLQGRPVRATFTVMLVLTLP